MSELFDRGDAPPAPAAAGNGAPPQPLRILLLPEQRQRVLAATGEDMEVLEVEDAHGSLGMVMPWLTPPEVERLALQQARARHQAEGIQRDALLALAASQDDEVAKQAELEQRRLAMEEWSAEQNQQMQIALAAGATVVIGGGAAAVAADAEPEEAEAEPTKKKGLRPQGAGKPAAAGKGGRGTGRKR